MIASKSVVFSALLLACFAEAKWTYNKPPWECRQCGLRDLSKETSDTSHCLDLKKQNLTIGDPLHSSRGSCKKIWGKANGEKFCLQKTVSKGQYFFASCARPLQDVRIPCRKMRDLMTWYRGKQSVSAFGNECVRWDEATTDFDDSVFFDSVFSTSYLDGFRNERMYQHENFCRNPTGSIFGPWCYVKDKYNSSRAVKEPCFHDCVQSTDTRLCLAKMLFPFTLDKEGQRKGIVDLDNINLSFRPKPRDPDFANVRDLSDILDLKEAFISPNWNGSGSPPSDKSASVPQFVPIYSLWYNRQLPSEGKISARNRCYQEGERTRLAGPWTYVKSPPPAPEGRHERHKDMFTTNHAMREELYGEQRPQLFRPCFYACEDVNITCIPDKNFAYYGLKDRSWTGAKCLSFHEAAKLVGRPEKKIHVHNVIFFYPTFTMNTKSGPVEIINDFARFHGSSLVSDKCMNIGRLLKVKPEGANFPKEFINVVESGPGCFIENTWGSGPNVVYERCFRQCDCSSDVKEPVYRRLFPANERHVISAMMDGVSEEKEHVVRGIPDPLLVNVNIYAIAMAALGGTFCFFAVTICILIALHKM